MGAELTARPVIGVPTSEFRRGEKSQPTPQGEPQREEITLGLKYLRAVAAAGGLPVILPPLGIATIEPLLSGLSGLCLPGGPDVHPDSYRRAAHPELGPTEPDADAFEIALVRAADRRRLPVLGICRGMQVINVARGGTLYQHLPDPRAGGAALEHRQQEPGHESTHPVVVERATLLASVLGARKLDVNSFHHQGVAKLGRRLAIAARSSDGVIEGMEAVDRDFMVGVQWHAECLTLEGRPEGRLFESLVEAACERRALGDYLEAA